MSDESIAEILRSYGEPFMGNVWRVQGQAVIYHKALERISAKAGIWFDDPSVIRSERDEAVVLVKGCVGPEGRASPYAQIKQEWSFGEALVGVNYRVTGRQAAYVYAMAEKRAKDRVILKLIGLHGLVYSEEEADEFRESSQPTIPVSDWQETAVTASAAVTVPSNVAPISSAQAKRDGNWTRFADEVEECATLDALDEWRAVRDEDIRRWPRAWKEEFGEIFRARRASLMQSADSDAYARARSGE